MWPKYATPADLPGIEAVPLAQRGLPDTTYAVLQRAGHHWPDRTAVTVLADATAWGQPVGRTFAQLLTDVNRVANLLRELGVRRTDAVALLSPNCDELITATLAAQLAGIAAPINGALAPAHIAELLHRSGARVAIVAAPQLDSTVWETASELARAGAIDTVLLLRPTGADDHIPAPVVDGVAVGYLSELSAGHDGDAFAGPTPVGTDLAGLFHTGGTTGAPKLAAHTHANEIADAWMIAANSAVPTVYAVLAQCPVNADVSSMRMAIVGASALPASVRSDFESHTGITLVEGYGLTEATCASARSFPDHPRAGSVGQRMPYQRLKTVRIDEPGRWHDLPPGTVGTLVISGPTVFPGYVSERGPDGFTLDGLGKLVDGWLDTGDLASVDADGFVHLTGRAKDLIIRGGHNIDPAVVEDALLAHPDVTGAAAVGRPDAHSGEVPVGYVTLKAQSDTTAEQLSAWAATHVTERAAAPKSVTIVDVLPVTAVGKPYKLALRADATRLAVADALAGIADVAAVDTDLRDGAPFVTVTVGPGADEDSMHDVLGRYPITYTVAKAS